ncbi:MAG: NERD domain-containing protein [Nitrososphaerota archaeon]|jgi:hypothetical protein|uniref:nuclease-related domain-containing protein n=1 Tax=Candidatus Bathycorpusculum sp. TaxID=2994959 RepID=UPI0028380A0D|nr:NERD domain-containing protein [Candidatus Termiticorpusculum sp.]MCL2257078.1 NERD domain-containing protein [Candidatus Termiticorpusculum sp.]MCL2292786.1 NERD domain-containing protein [Candidatus Termiticorpusculum sp.]MDR0460571.1 NERD domain-containing protein [Nitrososphaerota archaeon]
MRKIVGDSNYLKKQARKHVSRAILSFILFLLFLGLTGYRVLFQTQSLGLIEGLGLVASLIMLIMFQYCQRKYNIYKGGRQGENAVINTLANGLNDDYYLINGVCLKNHSGDIDHVLLGPSGVYVLETKNWSGKIVCNGDQWHRPGKNIKGNPSLQVKRNTQKIKKIVNAYNTLRGINIWVIGIIVFTNNHADLYINNPTVTVLKLQQLLPYIKNQESNQLTKQQVQNIVKQVKNA